MMSADFLVVGAGIAGVSVGCELAAAARVIVLECEPHPGLHATGRSAALFSESYGNPAIRALSRASRTFFISPPPGFAEAPLLRDRGVLYIGDGSQAALLDDMVASDAAGRLERIAADAAFRRVPILRRDRWSHFVLEAQAQDVDTDALLQGFLRLGRARGAELVANAVTHSIERTAGAWEIATRAGVFSAPVLIDAAGAWADEVAGLAGVGRVGLEPRRRTAFLIDAPQGAAIDDWPVVVEAAESFYFKPDAGRLLVSPADETPSAPCDAYPDDIDVAMAVERFEQATTCTVQQVRTPWAGLRSFVCDRRPVVGFDAVAPGFFWLAAQGGYGIQTAPALARLAAALACDRPVPSELIDEGVEPGELSPRRFASRGAM